MVTAESVARDAEIGEVWAAFRRTHDRTLRDRLILHYAPLVKYVASRVGAGLPRSVEQADLVSYGMFGLIDAIERFDPGRFVKFETYGMARIKGAIIDELRAIDWVPRSVRTKMREMEAAQAKLEHMLSRPPTDAEVAKELGITEVDLHAVYRRISAAGVMALDEVFAGRGDHGEHLTLGDTIADASGGPGVVLEEAETRKLLADALSKLPPRERTVLTLYYFENFNLAQIGEVLGVTESRACQIHAKAVMMLRSTLAVQWRERD